MIGKLNGDESLNVYAHQFKTLAFAGITISNPNIHIIPDVMNKNADSGFETGSYAKRTRDDLNLPSLTIGMNVLKKLHVYLSIDEKRLYLTEAGAPEQATPTKPQ